CLQSLRHAFAWLFSGRITSHPDRSLRRDVDSRSSRLPNRGVTRLGTIHHERGGSNSDKPEYFHHGESGCEFSARFNPCATWWRESRRQLGGAAEVTRLNGGESRKPSLVTSAATWFRLVRLHNHCLVEL